MKYRSVFFEFDSEIFVKFRDNSSRIEKNLKFLAEIIQNKQFYNSLFIEEYTYIIPLLYNSKSDWIQRGRNNI